MFRRATFVLVLSVPTLAAAGCDGGGSPTSDAASVDAAAVDTSVPGADGGPAIDGSRLDASGPLDAALPVDAATSVDAATPVDAFAGVDGGGSACGTARPALDATSGTEGLVIARDGTIYYSVRGGVARLAPDGTLDEAWLRVATGATIWGLALDASQTHLFIAHASGGEVRVATGLSGTPTSTRLAVVAQPNGVTVGPDGFVYVSDFAGDAVLAIDPTTGASTTVTTSDIAGADGVAFTDDGHLLVTSYSNGNVVSLALDAARHETSRTIVATSVPSADGVAVDENGVLYVGGGSRVYRIGTSGTPDTTLQMGQPGTANLEWGAGALDCHDLYVATGGGLTRIALDVGQRAVPWH